MTIAPRRMQQFLNTRETKSRLERYDLGKLPILAGL
jgi:hypothetical protein